MYTTHGLVHYAAKRYIKTFLIFAAYMYILLIVEDCYLFTIVFVYFTYDNEIPWQRNQAY